MKKSKNKKLLATLALALSLLATSATPAAAGCSAPTLNGVEIPGTGTCPGPDFYPANITWE